MISRRHTVAVKRLACKLIKIIQPPFEIEAVCMLAPDNTILEALTSGRGFSTVWIIENGCAEKFLAEPEVENHCRHGIPLMCLFESIDDRDLCAHVLAERPKGIASDYLSAPTRFPEVDGSGDRND